MARRSSIGCAGQALMKGTYWKNGRKRQHGSIQPKFQTLFEFSPHFRVCVEHSQAYTSVDVSYEDLVDVRMSLTPRHLLKGMWFPRISNQVGRSNVLMEEDTWTLSVHMATPISTHNISCRFACTSQRFTVSKVFFLAPRALTRLEAACFACDAVAGWKTRSKGIGEVVFSLQFTCAWNTQTQNIDLYYILVPRLRVLLTNGSVDGASGKWHQEPTSRMYTRFF